MGQLSIKHVQLQIVLPVIAGIFAFILVRPVFASVMAGDVKLAEQLASAENAVSTSVESHDGHSQVFVSVNGKKTVVSLPGVNSRFPFARGEYLVYVSEINGEGQIFRYHIPTQTTIQISNTGSNTEPKVNSEGKVVWKGWSANHWDVYYFDGKSISRLTRGESIQHPDISTEAIVYAKKTSDGIWQSQYYSLTAKTTTVVASGINAKFPEFDGTQLVFFLPGGSKEIVPLQSASSATSSPPTESHARPQPTIQSSETDQITKTVKVTATGLPTTTLIDSPAPSPSDSPTPLPTVTPTEVSLDAMNQELREGIDSTPSAQTENNAIHDEDFSF